MVVHIIIIIILQNFDMALNWRRMHTCSWLLCTRGGRAATSRAASPVAAHRLWASSWTPRWQACCRIASNRLSSCWQLSSIWYCPAEVRQASLQPQCLAQAGPALHHEGLQVSSLVPDSSACTHGPMWGRRSEASGASSQGGSAGVQGCVPIQCPGMQPGSRGYLHASKSS